jgi:hypothetical protein
LSGRFHSYVGPLLHIVGFLKVLVGGMVHIVKFETGATRERGVSSHGKVGEIDVDI